MAGPSSPAVAEPLKDKGLEAPKKIEYGCEHLLEKASPHIFKSSFTKLQKAILEKPEIVVQSTKEAERPEKQQSLATLRATYWCLECENVCGGEEVGKHAEGRMHCFYVESRSGYLFCASCDDFVYDPALEKARSRVRSGFQGSKKRKLSAMLNPSNDEKHQEPVSCTSGPRDLYNLGQTCYMSAVLQAVVHNPLIRNHFLANGHDAENCEARQCISCLMHEATKELWTGDRLAGYASTDLLFQSWKKQPDLAGYKQQDSHEYFQFLVNALHDTSGCMMPVNSKGCKCIYHQSFFGIFRNTVTCSQCKQVTVTEDPFIDVSVDLQGPVKRRRLEEPGTKSEGQGELDLTLCLEQYTSAEQLDADGYTCRSEECRTTSQTARKQMTMRKVPPALCIQLKRFEHTNSISRLTTRVNFPLQLDMTPYTTRSLHLQKASLHQPVSPTSPLFPRSPPWYDLSSAVVHIGKNVDVGHYVAYCKREGKWFKYDDHKVTLVGEEGVSGCDPYLLFYVARPSNGAKKDECGGEKCSEVKKDGEVVDEEAPKKIDDKKDDEDERRGQVDDDDKKASNEKSGQEESRGDVKGENKPEETDAENVPEKTNSAEKTPEDNASEKATNDKPKEEEKP